MIKIAATISKKVPLPDIQYSSQSYGASLEIEVSDGDKPDAIKARINELYALLSDTIDQQIGVGAQQTQAVTPTLANRVTARSLPPRALPKPVQASQTNGHNRPAAATNGNGRSVTSTQAQQRAIFAICKAQGLDMTAVLADYNCTDASQLHVKDASQLIDRLKANQNGQPAQ